MPEMSWFLWKEVEATGDLEDWLTRMVGKSEISADSSSEGLAALGNQVYASVQAQLEKEHPGKTALIILSSQLARKDGKHRIIIALGYDLKNMGPGSLIEKLEFEYGQFFAYTRFIGSPAEAPNTENKK